MSELNVITLQAGLERAHGLEAVYLSDKTTTAFVYMVARRGLPLHVGWFDNSRKSLTGPNRYALTTYPADAVNTHHRLILAQSGGQDWAHLTEERSADYLEGYDDAPTITDLGRLEQPGLATKLRTLVMDACVLPASVGYELDRFAWANDYDVPAVEAYGRALIDAGNYLIQIDDPALNNYVAGN